MDNFEVVELVKFNNRIAYVLNGDFKLTYEKHGLLLIGSDDTNTFFSVLYYGACGGNPNFGGNYAFGGRKFDLPMKDGSVTHCYGQYWDGKYGEAEKVLNIKFADFTHGTVEGLSSCYVFTGGLADYAKLQIMESDFYSRNPGYEPWEYHDYEKYIKGK